MNSQFEGLGEQPFLDELTRLESDHAANYLDSYCEFNDQAKEFESFFFESIKRGEEATLGEGWAGRSNDYPQFVMSMVIAFRGFRSNRLLAKMGYPLFSFGKLRDLKEGAIGLAGYFGGVCSFEELMGAVFEGVKAKGLGETPESLGERINVSAAIRKNRKATEKRLRKEIVRSTPGLNKNDVQQLQVWSDAFSQEVHGSQFSMAIEAIPWMIEGKELSIGPAPQGQAMLGYMNGTCQMAWFYCRLLPFLQVSEEGFGPEWQDRLRSVEAKLNDYVLDKDGGRKKQGEALAKWVNHALPFSVHNAFPSA